MPGRLQRKISAKVTGSADMQGACGAWLVLPSNHFKGCVLSCPLIAKSRKEQEWFHETTFWEVEKLHEDRASKMIDLALVCSAVHGQRGTLKLREALALLPPIHMCQTTQEQHQRVLAAHPRVTAKEKTKPRWSTYKIQLSICPSVRLSVCPSVCMYTSRVRSVCSESVRPQIATSPSQM